MLDRANMMEIAGWLISVKRALLRNAVLPSTTMAEALELESITAEADRLKVRTLALIGVAPKPESPAPHSASDAGAKDGASRAAGEIAPTAAAPAGSDDARTVPIRCPKCRATWAFEPTPKRLECDKCGEIFTFEEGRVAFRRGGTHDTGGTADGPGDAGDRGRLGVGNYARAAEVSRSYGYPSPPIGPPATASLTVSCPKCESKGRIEVHDCTAKCLECGGDAAFELHKPVIAGLAAVPRMRTWTRSCEECHGRGHTDAFGGRLRCPKCLGAGVVAEEKPEP